MTDSEEFPIDKCTVQLYYAPIKKDESLDIDDSPPEQIASGVLIKNASKHFLLTCKHVFDGIKLEDVVILTSGGWSVRLPDDVEFINDEKDNVDLALIQLKSYRLKELKRRYSFLSSKYLGFDHVFDEELWYMLYGYINKRTVLDNYAFYSEPFGFLTGIRHYRNFEKLGFSYENNISLEYNRRKQTYLDDEDEIRRFGPKDLRGLSGGGIWLSVAGKKEDTYEYILVGTLIEERIERGFLIGTKIGLIKGKLLPSLTQEFKKKSKSAS